MEMPDERDHDLAKPRIPGPLHHAENFLVSSRSLVTIILTVIRRSDDLRYTSAGSPVMRMPLW